jgi:hypothetical protein
MWRALFRGQNQKFNLELMMKWLSTAGLLTAILLAGCSSNMDRAFYEGFKSQNEGYKTPNERAMNPAPSYDTYSKERESLKQKTPSAE